MSRFRYEFQAAYWCCEAKNDWLTGCCVASGQVAHYLRRVVEMVAEDYSLSHLGIVHKLTEVFPEDVAKYVLV